MTDMLRAQEWAKAESAARDRFAQARMSGEPQSMAAEQAIAKARVLLLLSDSKHDDFSRELDNLRAEFLQEP